VSKYDNKFKKSVDAKPAEKSDFRAQLKVVKKENTLETLEKKVKRSDKPEWSNKAGAVKKDAPAAPPKEEKPKEDKPADEPAEEPEEEEEEEEGEEEEEEEEEE